MKAIIGLGNPGNKYFETRHNIGFMVIDQLANNHHVTLTADKKLQANIGSFFYNGEKILLVEPTTYMNESGQAVRAIIDYYDIAIDDMMIIYDDLDLAVGKLRLRQTGSAGGHNGIKSIIAHLNTKTFPRAKVGIDRPKNKTVVQHVLSSFNKDEYPIIQEAVTYTVQAIDYFLDGHSFEQVMNQFNKK